MRSESFGHQLNRSGGLDAVNELDLPTSLDFAVFITTLNGEVWKITNVSKFVEQ